MKTEDDERAVTRDFDGNMIEAVYVPRGSRGGGSHRERAVTLETASSEKEAKRVLEWQENVARSISEEPDDDEPRGSSTARRRVEYSQSAPRPGTFHRSETFPRTRPRRDTITADSYRQDTKVQERDHSPLGISGNAMLGTIIAGAAAFALFQTVTHARATAPDPIPASSSAPPPRRRRASETHYTHSPIRMEDRETVVERIPARSYVSQREREERTTPRYVQYNVVTKPSAPPMVREMKRIDDKSYVSASPSHRSHRTQRERSRSDVGVRPYEHRPLTINPAPERETQSHVSTSRRSHRSESHRERSGGSSGSSGKERERRREKERERERERDRDRSRDRSHTDSYASARTHHSVSTVKPSKQPLPEVPAPPPAASYVSTSTVRAARNPRPPLSHISERERERARDIDRERATERRNNEWDRIERARMVPLPESVISARQVPLPRSMVGYEYEASVAPSDSVSSVGVKRERERLKERMRERGLQGRWDA